MSRRSRTFTRAQREEALALADRLGSTAEAGRRLGIPGSTLRRWRSEAAHAGQAESRKVPGPPAGTDPQRWAADKRGAAREAFAGAQEAIARVRELLDAGKARDAQHAAIVAGVLVDKVAALEVSADRADEGHVRLAEGRAQLIAVVITQYMEAVGLPFGQGSPARKVLAAMLRQAEAGEVISPPGPEAEAATAEIRRRVAAELREQLLGEIEPEWMAEHRGLPAAGETEAVEPGELAAPERVVRTVPNTEREVSRPGEVLAPHGVQREAGFVPW